jgi:hypothetical protein
MGIRVASFQWVMQCLMQRERLELDSHITFTVRARSVGEVVWLKRNKKSSFEPATITTSGSTQYKVHFLSDGAAMNGVTEQQVLHCDESLHRGIGGGGSGGSSGSSGSSGSRGGHWQLPIWVGASSAVNNGMTSDLEYGAFTLHQQEYSVGDTCLMVDGRVGTIERLFATSGGKDEHAMRMRWRLLVPVEEEGAEEGEEGEGEGSSTMHGNKSKRRRGEEEEEEEVQGSAEYCETGEFGGFSMFGCGDAGFFLFLSVGFLMSFSFLWSLADEIVECNVSKVSNVKIMLMDEQLYNSVLWSEISDTKEQKVLYLKRD